jgi:hypothetical protein
MTTHTSLVTADVIRAALDDIDLNASVRTDYIGRGMSRPCVGIVIDDLAKLPGVGMMIAFILANNTSSAADPFAAAEAIDTATPDVLAGQIDSMGRDYIVYWPRITA